VTVAPLGDLRVGVAEQLLHRDQVRAEHEEHARVGVAQVVEADRTHLSLRPEQEVASRAAAWIGVGVGFLVAAALHPQTERRVKVTTVNVPGFSKSLSADKYDAAKAALLKALPRKAPGLSQREMFDAAKPHLPATLFPRGAKAEWWLKSVQLNLEAKGIVVRDPKLKPLRWRRAK